LRALLRRHASEQYLTSAQFLDQLRRQLIGKPHATQGLLGKFALFPRCWEVALEPLISSLIVCCVDDDSTLMAIYFFALGISQAALSVATD
jgi:hypothetical protein